MNSVGVLCSVCMEDGGSIRWSVCDGCNSRWPDIRLLGRQVAILPGDRGALKDWQKACNDARLERDQFMGAAQ